MNGKMLFYFAIVSFPVVASVNWQNISPMVSRVTVSGIVQTNSSLIIGTDTGIYRCTKKNESLALIDSSLAGVKILKLISFHDNIFAATDSGVWFSSDGGHNWVECNKGISELSGVGSIAANDSNVFIATFSGIYRLSDTTHGWIKILSDPTWEAGPRGVFANSIDIVSWDWQWCKWSSNNGTTWQNYTRPLYSIYGFFLNDTTWYLWAKEGIFFSRDNGTTWISAQFPGSLNSEIWADSTAIYASSIESGLMRSFDNGVHWASFNNGLTGFHIFSMSFGRLGTFIATDNGIFKLENNTLTWKRSDLLLTNISISSLYTKDSNLIISSSGGGFRSLDCGKTWLNLRNNAAVNTAYANDSFLFVPGSYLARSGDSGTTWADVGVLHMVSCPMGMPSPCYGKEISSIAVFGNQLIAISRQTPYMLFRSLDNGLNWKQESLCPYLYSANFKVCEGTIYSLEDYMRSDDTGKTWVNYGHSNYEGQKALIKCGGYLYFANYMHGVTRVSVDGSDYVPLADGLPVDTFSNTHTLINANDICMYYTTMFVATENHGVYASIDSAKHWFPYNVNIEQVTISTLQIDPPYLYAGTNTGLYSIPLNNVDAIQANRGQLMGRVGSIIIKQNHNGIVVSVRAQDLTNVSARIFNIVGQAILNLDFKAGGQGVINFRWNGKNKNGTASGNGRYFLVVKHDHLVQTVPFTILQ